MFTIIERIQRDIETLAQFNATPGQGLTRLSLSLEDRGAREYLKEKMLRAGLSIREDAAGTLIGRIEGEVPGAPVVMVGSHYDSVKNGGMFDGPAGVVAALEIARVITERQKKFKHPIEFVAMIEEEGSRFGRGLFASRAMTGNVSREELDDSTDTQGVSLAQAMKDFGFDPDRINEAVRKPKGIKAFLELHIEQGPILEHEGKDIGIVEYVVGIAQLEVIVKGRPDHAGTTPMNMRMDALDAASQVISMISQFAIDAGGGTVATVGFAQVYPGAANIVPGEVCFRVDVRSKEESCIDAVIEQIQETLEKVRKVKGIEYTIEKKLRISPIKLNQTIFQDLCRISDELGYKKQIMFSGAGHDAMVMASITDVGLIFVKSKNGRSHCPEEWTDYEDLQKGIEVLCLEVFKLAEEL